MILTSSFNWLSLAASPTLTASLRAANPDLFAGTVSSRDWKSRLAALTRAQCNSKLESTESSLKLSLSLKVLVDFVQRLPEVSGKVRPGLVGQCVDDG